MTDQELKDLVASLAVAVAETARLQQETDRQLQETDRQLQVTDRQMQETDRKLREVGQQIGGLGEKFGSLTEGMAFPAMKKLLQERFGMTSIALRALARRNGRSLELDVLAYSNTEKNEAYVVEVKSHLREDGLLRFLEILADFSEFFPEHRGKKLYGILAAIDIPEDLRQRVLAHGVYLAQISGETFELQTGDDFEPRSFQA